MKELLKGLVEEYNDIFVESRFIIEKTISELKSELGQYGIIIDEEAEEGATLFEDVAFTWNFVQDGTAKLFYCDVMDRTEYEEAYEVITEVEDEE